MTHKDHFLHCIDQILEKLAKKTYFCFLDGHSGFLKIPIHPSDQEKTTTLIYTEHLHIGGCHSGYVMPPPPFNVA